MYIFSELILNFWLWWYIESLTDLVDRQLNTIGRIARFTGLTTHIRYFFVPLYQQTDISSRLISLVFRGIMILIGLVSVALAVIVSALTLIVYLVLPILPVIYIWILILNA